MDRSVFQNYVHLVVERHGAPAPSELPRVQRGPAFAQNEWRRENEALTLARGRVDEERILGHLSVMSQIELISGLPLGVAQPLDEVIQIEPKLVLLGAGGAGKTAALRALLTHTAAQGELVAWISLPDLMDSVESLPEYLSQDAQRRLSIEMPADVFAQALVNGHSLVCLDGLDGVVGQAARSQAVQLVQKWAERFPRCRFVVACRTDGEQPDLGSQFARYFLTAPQHAGDTLRQAWNESLDNWTAEPRQAKNCYYASRHRLWAMLALAMLEQNIAAATTEQAQDWLAAAAERDKSLKLNKRQAHHEAELLLKESPAHLKLLALSKDLISFEPRLTREVLAAQALVTRGIENGVEAIWTRLASHLWDVNWRETLALTFRFLAQEQPALWNELIARILTLADQDPLELKHHRHTLLAASLLASSPASPELEQTPILDRLMAWLHDATAAGHRDALNVLAQMEANPAAWSALYALAQESGLSVGIQGSVALLLGQLGMSSANEAADLLIGWADNADLPDLVRQSAVYGLSLLVGRGGPADVIEPRLVEWTQHPDLRLYVRIDAVEVLGRVIAQTRTPAALDVLMALAHGQNAKEKSVPFSIQDAAARALLQVWAATPDEAMDQALWTMAQDEQVHDSVRVLLAEPLGRAGHAAETAQILLRLGRQASTFVGQQESLQALARVGYADQDILDGLKAMAQTSDRSIKDFVRLTAAHTLGLLGERDLSTQYILRILADKSIYRSTRLDAFKIIHQMGWTGIADLDQAMITVLRVWAREENTTEDVREQAMEILSSFGVDQEAFVQDLIANLQNKREYTRVRRVAAKALGVLPATWQPQAREALNTELYDQQEGNDNLRVMVSRSLLRFGPDEVVIKYLQEATVQSYLALVRYESSLYLGEYGLVEPAIPALIALIQDPQIVDTIRQGALYALSLWGGGRQEVIDAVAGVFDQPTLEPNVRHQAYQCLKTVLSA